MNICPIEGGACGAEPAIFVRNSYLGLFRDYLVFPLEFSARTICGGNQARNHPAEAG